MNNLYVAVLFLVFITSISSTLCDNGNEEELAMVVDDQAAMHDAGIGITKANPVQIENFLLDDGKVLTLSRKSSPNRICVGRDQPCGAVHWCCEGLKCNYPRFFSIEGKCRYIEDCVGDDRQCGPLLIPCCYPLECSGIAHKGTCIHKKD